MAERSVYEQALVFLEFKARSVAELRRKLLQKGGSAEEVDEVIQRLLDQKLLDDAGYARQFARGKLASAGASRHRIAQELSRKGIRRDAANEAIETLTEEEGIDPMAAASRVARKKWKALQSLDEVTRKRRLYAFLARRGFNPDEIRMLMREVEAES
ncbi:MAG TPA: regulatory protein RecX [Gemmatimonadaceae bacterium]|nr:regulatory protein RecX [Gemmatimonadaceae bacterium]